MKKVIIIGGGLGGLFTGAILAKEGFDVTVLEKNSTIGGGLQTFKRFGESFDTGMHVIGGMQPGGCIRRICSYLGIMDKVEIKEVDDECSDYLYFAEDRASYRLGKGKELFYQSLVRNFPEDAADIKQYINAVFALTDQIDLLNLRPSNGIMNLFAYSDDYLLSADGFIAKYVKNKKLASVLAYLNPLYGGRGNQTPAYIHAIISTLYINGTTRFVGGSNLFANLLRDVIIENGGHVQTNNGVEWIEVNNRHVEFVRTVKGEMHTADYYISDIHPCSLFKLVPEKTFPKPFRKRLNELPNAYSAFSVFIKLKENSFPYINHTEYYMTKYDDIWKFGRTDTQWPLGFLFMTPPERNQGKYANKAIITAPMSFEEVREWEATSWGHRTKGYEVWKERKADELFHLVEEIHPGFRDCVIGVNTASPLTIRDFYAAKDGTLCGFSKDYSNIVASQVPVVTKIDNLLLTGQNNNLHGFCGVPLTAINTCEAILGINYIINKINACVPN
jgi:all-trans-retinol 13,14-reductase